MASNLVKAIRIEQHGGPEVLKLVEVEVPLPAATRGHHLTSMRPVNFIDIYFRTGLYPHPLPHGLGLRGAGVVIAVSTSSTQEGRLGRLRPEPDRLRQGPQRAANQVAGSCSRVSASTRPP